MIDPHIFRAYDIRGKAHTQLTEEACFLIGRAFGSVLRERYQKEHPTVVVGRDARTHGPVLEAKLIEGLLGTGCTVKTIGETPSPVNYFAVCHFGFDAGMHVTASHNPKEDNGIKLQTRGAEAFSGDDLQDLRRRIERGEFLAGTGIIEPFDAATPYIEFLSKEFSGIGTGVAIVVDGGNGVACPIYCEVLRRVGCAITGLYLEPDGTFPNHPADPSKHSTLRELQDTVRMSRAHCGLAYDGDGDRLGLVDETGAIVTADQTLLLLAEDHLQRHPGAPVIFTVSNSGLLETEVRAFGGTPVMCKVGHSFVEHAMREHGSSLGGEQSGHFFCGERYFGFDDALVASLRVLSIMKHRKKPMSSLIGEFPRVYQSPERRPPCPDGEKAQVIDAVIRHFQKTRSVITLDGVRVDFGDGAWAGIRMSNTSPVLSICIEARSEEKLRSVEEEVITHLQTYPSVRLDEAH